MNPELFDQLYDNPKYQKYFEFLQHNPLSSPEYQQYLEDLPYEYLHKVNLKHLDGMSEGIWASFIGTKDKIVYDTDNVGSYYIAVLCNEPLGWNNCEYGSPVIVQMCGKDRPTAVVRDQTQLTILCLKLASSSI